MSARPGAAPPRPPAFRAALRARRFRAALRGRSFRAALRAFVADDAGPTAVEYALIALGVALVVVGAVYLLGTTLNDSFKSSAGKLSNPP